MTLQESGLFEQQLSLEHRHERPRAAGEYSGPLRIRLLLRDGCRRAWRTSS
jgi:hypothetical protein